MVKPRPRTPAPSKPAGQRRLLRLESRLSSVEDFIRSFSRLVDEDTLFVATRSTFDVGLRRNFAVTLSDGQTVFGGEAEVVESPARYAGPESPLGLRLRLLKLTAPSIVMHARLLAHRREVAQIAAGGQAAGKATRAAGKARNVAPLSSSSFTFQVPKSLKTRPKTAVGLGPPERARPPRQVKRQASEQTPEPPATAAPAPPPRTTPPPPRAGPVAKPPPGEPRHEEPVKGSDLILPANPLSDISDVGLHELVECVIYEDCGFPREEPGELLTPRPELARAPDLGVRAIEDAKGKRKGKPYRARPDGVAEAVPEAIPDPALGATEPEVAPAAPARRRDEVPVAVPAAARGEVPGEAVLPQAKAGLGLVAPALIALFAIGVGFVAGYLAFGSDELLSGARAAEPAEPAEPAADEELAAIEAAEPSGDAADRDQARAPEDRSVEASPAAGPLEGACVARVRSTPAGAEVRLDGESVGRTPIEALAVPCGDEVTVAVERQGFRAHEETLRAEPGALAEVDARLARPQSRLRIVSDPPGAIVTINGRVVGRAPVRATAPQASRVLVTATLRGHKVWTRELRAARPQMLVRARLEKIAD